MAKPYLSFQRMVFPHIWMQCAVNILNLVRGCKFSFLLSWLYYLRYGNRGSSAAPFTWKGKNSSSVVFHIFSVLFVGRKRCLQHSNLQSHSHKPMEQVIFVGSLIQLDFFHPVLLMLKRWNLAEKLAGSLSRLLKKLNIKDNLSRFLPLCTWFCIYFL